MFLLVLWLLLGHQALEKPGIYFVITCFFVLSPLLKSICSYIVNTPKATQVTPKETGAYTFMGNCKHLIKDTMNFFCFLVERLSDVAH